MSSARTTWRLLWSAAGRPERVARAAVAASGTAALTSAAEPTEAHAEGSGGADLMGAVMATTVASLIATEYAIHLLEQPTSGNTGSVQPETTESAATVPSLPSGPPTPTAPVPASVPTAAPPPPPQPQVQVVPVPQPTGTGATTPELPLPPPGAMSTWAFMCAALALVGCAAAVRKGAQSPVTQRLVARPSIAQASVTVAQRQALRKARSDKWYSRLPARKPGEVWSAEAVSVGARPLTAHTAVSVADHDKAWVSAAGGRTPRLWCGEGDLRQPTSTGPVTCLAYSAHGLSSLVRKESGDLVALLSSLPGRGAERVQPGSTIRAASPRPTGPRTPNLEVHEPDPLPLPSETAPVTPPAPPTVANDAPYSGNKVASVALLRDLADALSAQRGTLAAMFAEVDADGSVSLDKRELREMITRKLRVELGDSEMQIIWSQLDADGSVRGASW
jgi:hypothetical protein